MAILLGGIADDFTGATDLANTLVRQGMRTVQVIGVPDDSRAFADTDAVVVALKSRTAPVEDAVAASLGALERLRALGARQIFFKYCSTFDSTPDGNIGPVADALLDALGEDFALVCPALPVNGRTVYQGHLFVGDRLLSESPMKDHPLTPMRHADLRRLMGAQARRSVGLIPHAVVAGGADAIGRCCDDLRRQGIGYAVVDALTEADLRRIGAAAAGHRLVTGGSGMALGLAENFRQAGLLDPSAAASLPEVRGRQAVLAGSCSQATRAQIAHIGRRWPSRALDPDRLAADKGEVEEIVDWASGQPADTPVLVYSSADPAGVAAVQARLGGARAGALIEEAFGQIAQGLVAAGYRRLLVAGGETAGAVVSALGVSALKIGPEIDPGVPWTETLNGPPLALALKSGNFGDEDFFVKALGVLP